MLSSKSKSFRGPPLTLAPVPAQAPLSAPPRMDHSITDFSHLPYYHPQLSSLEQVKQLFINNNKEGCFILRNSFSKPGCYTVSVLHSSGIKHFNIEMTTAPASFRLKDRIFATMDQLIQNYGYEDVPNKEIIGNVRLKFPIKRNDRVSNFSKKHQSAWDQEDQYLETQMKNMAPFKRQTIHPVIGTKHTKNSDYSAVDSEPQSKLSSIIASAKLTDEPKRCDCGLLEEEAVLPRGWSVHLSQDAATFGEIYFMSPEGRTHWHLPLTVSLEMTPTQQDIIRDLLLDFENTNHRFPRAMMPEQTAAERIGSANIQRTASQRHWQTDNCNYIAPSPLDVVNVPRVSALGCRSSMYPIDAESSAVDNEQSDADNTTTMTQPVVGQYMPMNGTHLKKI